MSHKTIAASRPAAIPPTAPSTFPAAPFAADALGLVADEVLVEEEVAAAELTAVDWGTLLGWRLPHCGQDLEPGVLFSHWAYNSWHSLFGREPWYWSIFAGGLPSGQVQVYTRLTYVEK